MLSSALRTRVVCGSHGTDLARAAAVSCAVVHHMTAPSPPPLTSVSPSSRRARHRTPLSVTPPPESSGIFGPGLCALSLRVQCRPLTGSVTKRRTSPSLVPATSADPPPGTISLPRGGIQHTDMTSMGAVTGENLEFSAMPGLPFFP